MNPVVGIDVLNGESEGYIFLERNKAMGKSFRFNHTYNGIHILTLKLLGAESLESTGHYHLKLVATLQK